MQTAIKYIELKSGYNDSGPAWIGLVSTSKTGKTLYFNGKAFQSLKGSGIYANYYDLETGEEYWISGVKKNGCDRHWAGGGPIFIERRVQDMYRELLNIRELDSSKYIPVTVIEEPPIEKIREFENQLVSREIPEEELCFKAPHKLNDTDLSRVITHLNVSEREAKYNKGRRATKSLRLQFEAEVEKRSTL